VCRDDEVGVPPRRGGWGFAVWFLAAALFATVGRAATPPGKAAVSRGRAAIADRVQSPFLGAIVVDADTGKTLIEQNADAQGYPASVIKLMDILIILEKAKTGALKLDDKVLVTAEASTMGGSQVYLKENESIPVDDLLYALMVQSGNDAAVALALHVAGTRDGFVALMNQKAAEIGMKNTRFASVHGLPPAEGQEPDVSTARDLATLARALLSCCPEVLRYTSTQTKGFRGDTFIMRNHNQLLGTCDGVDGLKTGYFRVGGYSSVVTAKRGGRRVIAVVLGSQDRATRDQNARDLLAKGFLALPPPAPPAPTNAPVVATNAAPAEHEKAPSPPAKKGKAGRWILLGVIVAVAAGCFIRARRLPKM
jgi:D-alanyl-D-alanine carboxypeptidase (penicillin-binding protein 5/6)